MHHIAIAAVHQHIGDLLLDRRAAGNREQMRLALLLRDADKIGGGQPRRLRQHRPRNRDLVVMRETLDDVVRRLCDRREAARKLRARLGFDPCDQVRQHVVEYADLLVAELGRRDQKQVGDAPERVDPLFPRSALNRLFQFVHQRLLRAHGWCLRRFLRTCPIPG